MIETTGEGKSAVATPDGEKPKEEEEEEATFHTLRTVRTYATIGRMWSLPVV